MKFACSSSDSAWPRTPALRIWPSQTRRSEDHRRSMAARDLRPGTQQRIKDEGVRSHGHNSPHNREKTITLRRLVREHNSLRVSSKFTQTISGKNEESRCGLQFATYGPTVFYAGNTQVFSYIPIQHSRSQSSCLTVTHNTMHSISTFPQSALCALRLTAGYLQLGGCRGAPPADLHLARY